MTYSQYLVGHPASHKNLVVLHNRLKCTYINLNLRIPFVGEEESGERKETWITDIGPQTNKSITLNSKIIPSVLIHIVVNPTTLDWIYINEVIPPEFI